MTPWFWEKMWGGTRKHSDPTAFAEEATVTLARERVLRRLGESRIHDVHWMLYAQFLEKKVFPRLHRIKYPDYRRQEMMDSRHIIELIEDGSSREAVPEQK